MSARKTLPLVTLVAATNATGCYSTWDIEPRAFLQIDGFHENQPTKMRSVDDSEVVLTRDSELHFRGTDGIEVDTRFSSFHVHDNMLSGTVLPSGEQLHVDLMQMKTIQVTGFSRTKAALVATSIVLGTVAAGVGGVFIFALGTSGSGRPLRLAGQSAPVRAPLRRVPLRARGTRLAHTDQPARERLFAHWAQEASAECASIPAFLALARDLSRANAPANLVHAALRAAREEATHTKLCTNLANGYTDAPVAPQMPETPRATDSNLESLLERLALEAFWDGCVAEGSAAAVARRSAIATRDETTRLALQTITRDEQNHADLARSIVAFGWSVGGRTVRQTLLKSFEEKRAAVEADLNASTEMANEREGDPDVLRAYGLADQDILQQARIEAWEKSSGMLRNLA